MSRDITQLHPKLQEKLALLIQKCEEAGLKIKITECLRTVAEQDALYAQGRTTEGNIVTNARGSSYSSMHQWGVAADFCRNDGKGAYNESGNFFGKVGAIGQSIGLEWGGNWVSIKDKPHFQLPDWGSTPARLKNMYGTPLKFHATWENINHGGSGNTGGSESTGDTFKEWVKMVQREIGAKIDGIPGPETLGKTPTLEFGSKSELVKIVQEQLNRGGYSCGTADGIFGKNTKAGVKKYQKNVVGLKNPDGVITAHNLTWKKLIHMA